MFSDWMRAIREWSAEWSRPAGNPNQLVLTIDAALTEGVLPRAMRDAKKAGMGTFSGGILVLCCTLVGVHLAGKDHAPHKGPAGLVEIGFPIAGFVVGAVVILLLRLLLTFRVQRNEARAALAVPASHAAPAGPKARLGDIEITGNASESSRDLLAALQGAGVDLTPEGLGARREKADAPAHGAKGHP